MSAFVVLLSSCTKVVDLKLEEPESKIAVDGLISNRAEESFVKLGLVPGDGGAWLLPRVVGFAKASELALTGDSIDAQEALNCGLVSKVVEPASLMDIAKKMAEKIASNPVHAVRMTKRLLREGQKTDLATLLEMSAAFQALAHATDDHKEAVAALLEKRTPQFIDA